MVHRFVSRCQFGPGTSRSQMQKCAIWLGMLGVVPGAGWNDPAPRGVSSWWSCLEGRNWFGPRGCSVWSPPGAERVVCARWCPTLPHPGGCSTIGAVRLSFRVRDGSGRFPVAVTTETTEQAVRFTVVSGTTLFGYPCDCPLQRTLCVVGGWVGCGPYSGRSRLPCYSPPGTPTHAVCVVCGGVVVCVGRLVPVSSQPLPVFHFWPINPVVCWGPTKKDKSFLWRPYLEDGFPLRCFQRLPFPNVANQPCPGRDNWHTRGSSVPVLSY